MVQSPGHMAITWVVSIASLPEPICRWAEPQHRGVGGLGPSQEIRPFQDVKLRTPKRGPRLYPALPLQMQHALGVAREMGLPEPVLEAATEQLKQMLGCGGGNSRQLVLSHPVPETAGDHATQELAAALQLLGHGGMHPCQVGLPKAVHEEAGNHISQMMGEVEENKPGLGAGIRGPNCKAEPTLQAAGEHVSRMLGEMNGKESELGVEGSGPKLEMEEIEP